MSHVDLAEGHLSHASERRRQILLDRYLRWRDLRTGAKGNGPGARSRVRGRERSHQQKHLGVPDLLDPATGWYSRWYFLARLEDELERAECFKQELSLVCLCFPLAHRSLPDEAQENLRQRLHRGATEALRASDVAGALSDEELIAYLPHTGRAEAVTVASKLKALLQQFQPLLSVAVFPQDGLTVDPLIEQAKLSAWRQSKIVNLEAYKTRRRLSSLLS